MGVLDREKLKLDLKRDEGYKTHVYRDTLGNYTIGVGHLVGEMPRMFDLLDDEIDALLERDIQHAEAVAMWVLPDQINFPIPYWFLDDVRSRALVNMAFNRGMRHMQESTTIVPAIRSVTLITDKDAWKKVADAILASPWAKQVGIRAKRLAYMFETGQDPTPALLVFQYGDR